VEVQQGGWWGRVGMVAVYPGVNQQGRGRLRRTRGKLQEGHHLQPSAQRSDIRALSNFTPGLHPAHAHP
jgi:hypothetical protein